MTMRANLERMLAGGRDDAMLRFGLGSACFNEKDFDAAVPHFEACLAHDPGYTAAWKLKGRALMQLGRIEDAIATFNEGISVAVAAGDKQAEREMTTFLAKLT